MVPKILLVEDDPTLVHALQTTLGLQYDMTSVATENDACHHLTLQPWRALIVDEVLQQGTGLNVIKHALKAQPLLPVVVITAQATKPLAIECLNLGVRKFVEKPFQLGELMGALKDVIGSDDIDLLPGWKLSRSRRRIEVDGEEASLTPIEYRIVEHLVVNANRCIPREEFIELLWGRQKVSNHALDTHLSSLRKKAKPLGDKIKVSRGRGYWWDV